MQYLQPTPRNMDKLNHIFSVLDGEFYLDRFSPRWVVASGVHNRRFVVNETYKMFEENHILEDYSGFENIKSDLAKLTLRFIDQDYVIVDNRIISLLVYRVLFICYQHLMLLNFVQDDKRDRDGIWKYYGQSRDLKLKSQNVIIGTSKRNTEADKTKFGVEFYARLRSNRRCKLPLFPHQTKLSISTILI